MDALNLCCSPFSNKTATNEKDPERAGFVWYGAQ
jgi:hypothetical protein